MCITPDSSFAQTAGGGSSSIPLVEDPSKFSMLGLPALLPGFFHDFTKLSPRDEAGTLGTSLPGISTAAARTESVRTATL